MSSTPQLPPLAKIEHKTIVDLISKGKHIDERQPFDMRSLDIEVGLIEKGNGSAQVRLGKTKVLVGVKVEPGTPFPDTPNEGILTVNAELVPLASPSFELGPPGESSIELARIVDRGIRESKALGLSKLCVEPGKKVFVVFVDVYVLDHDGNLIDASSIGALAAILNARMKEYEYHDGQIRFKDAEISLPVNDYPVSVTFARINDVLLADPCLEEEQVMSARLTVTTDRAERICAMQKGGLGTFSVGQVKEAVRMATLKGSDIRKQILAVAARNA